ncbi:MAG: hypothetical protein GY756_11025, partial [bacterium]|nr:hypothetical protein [bacterium]
MKKKILFLLLFLISINFSQAQWQHIIGTPTEVIGSIVNGNNLIAGSGYQEGIFLSTDDGNTWTAVNTGIPNYDIALFSSIAISGNNIFAGFSSLYQGAGIFLSTNSGSNWTAVNTGLTDSNIVDIVVMGNNIFARSHSHGVFLSTNNGNSWTNLPSSIIPGHSFFDLAANSTTLFMAMGDGVYRSTDNGNTWTLAIGIDVTGDSPRRLAVFGNTIFAIAFYSGVWVSTDNGSTFTNKGLSTFHPTDITHSGNNFFVVTQDGVQCYMTSNNGNNWTGIGTGLPTYCSSLNVNSNYLYFFPSWNSLYRRPLSELVGINELNSETKVNI